jgi:hypothetical protein
MSRKERSTSGMVYNSFYVHYDNEGTVHLLSNVKEDKYKVFEIDLFLIDDFINGKKDFRKYNIEYFYNLSKGIRISENDTVEYSKPLFQILPLTYNVNDTVILEHNTIDHKWTVYFDEEALEKLEVLPPITFYICKKDDPHYLYRYFTVDASNIIDGKIDYSFETNYEENLGQISVATLKRFPNYGIKEKYE